VVEISGREMISVGAAQGARILVGIIPLANQPIVYITASGTATFGTANVSMEIEAGRLVTTVTGIVLP
jgi:hypothetical protein